MKRKELEPTTTMRVPLAFYESVVSEADRLNTSCVQYLKTIVIAEKKS